MSSALSETDDTLQMVLLLGIVGAVVWAFVYLQGLFGNVDPNDPLGIATTANTAANSVRDTIRTIMSGGAKSSLTQEEMHQYGVPEPPFAATDLLPNWINTATWFPDPETSGNAMGGVGVSGTW